MQRHRKMKTASPAPLFLLALVTSWVRAATGQDALPRPEQPVNAEVGRTYKDSKPGNIGDVRAPAGAPNIVVVLLDDAGFGAAGTFGGPVPTATFDRLANQGLRYNAFHTTALCSPTRAALLTGRNHHAANSGMITELATGFDGYSSVIPRSTATIAEILRQHGYNTAAYGKWHNTPTWETSLAGPFDHWPTGMGFEEFYGFLGGDAHQYEPALYHGTVPIERPKTANYTLNDDLADQAISWIRRQKSIAPEKPFFIWWAPGATHAPHHVPPVWSDKFKDQFNQGWDKLREETFERQKKLGVIPANAKLTPRPAPIPAWDSLSPERKNVSSRLMEIYAGFLAQTDYEIGRLVDSIQQIGQWNNTLFVCIIGDNGASAEGSPTGVLNEMSVLNGVPEDPSIALQHFDELGTTKAYNHYPAGFAWACDTPFQWAKQIASHFGGTRNPMIITWPNKIKDAGGLRTQFHHCIDLAPTILEAVGIPAPSTVNGTPQKPLDGVSMVYTFDDAKAAGRRGTQYFEMMGNLALYHDGWIASCFHGRSPWEAGRNLNFDTDKWELYNLADDFSQADDLAASNPEKLRKLQDLFWGEAAKFNVLPLDDRGFLRVDFRTRPALPGSGRTNFTFYSGTTRIPEAMAPNTKNKSWSATAVVEIPKDGAQGVIAALGGVTGGWALYLDQGVPEFTYNFLASVRYTIKAKEKLPAGEAAIRYEFAIDGGIGPGRGGVSKLYVNGSLVAEGRIDRTVPVAFSADETFDIGIDEGSPVGLYPGDFAFSGTIKQVEIELGK